MCHKFKAEISTGTSNRPSAASKTIKFIIRSVLWRVAVIARFVNEDLYADRPFFIGSQLLLNLIQFMIMANLHRKRTEAFRSAMIYV